MEYVLTSKEMQEADQYTILRYTPSIELMERAGFECFKLIKSKIKNNNKILVVCGSGGNGGDGLVIARYFFEENFDVSIYLIGSHYKKETEINLNRYKGKILKEVKDLNINDFDVIIDCILGVGVSNTLKKEYIDLIKYLNEISAYKVSIDVNSGIDSTTGESLGIAFYSNLTIAINNYKTGHFFNDGISVYDELTKVDIGIILNKDYNYAKLFDYSDFSIIFPKRNRNTNKGSYGRVALIGGNKLTPGALNLSLNALAALRGGVGYVTLCVPMSLYPIYALKNNENIYYLLSDSDGQIIFKENEISKLLNYNAIAIGMGIGTSIEIYKIIDYLLKNFTGNLLIDADGLNSLAKYGIDILKEHKCNVILTPHIKEFSRISNISINELKKDYINNAKKFAVDYNVILNLKNDISVITNGNETIINTNGNAGLAKGGSGDVLSGITLSLLNKNDNLLERVACGAFILGEAADFAIKDINEYSLIASDLSKYLIHVFNKLMNIKSAI